jgi:thiamine pyrophosphate-dependent acetolactate synthase large subunit-like protein
MNLTHMVLNNDELAKITREQVGAMRPVWQTSLINPGFAEFARLCGGSGYRGTSGDELEAKLRAALDVEDGPSLVEVTSSGRWV